MGVIFLMLVHEESEVWRSEELAQGTQVEGFCRAGLQVQWVLLQNPYCLHGNTLLALQQETQVILIHILSPTYVGFFLSTPNIKHL